MKFRNAAALMLTVAMLAGCTSQGNAGNAPAQATTAATEAAQTEAADTEAAAGSEKEAETTAAETTAEETTAGKAATVRDKVLPKMKELRECCDRAEVLVGKEYWPFPTYEGLLYSVE